MSIKAIHTIKSRLGLSEGDYRALLMRVAGVRSSKQLTGAQDRAVMDALEAMRTDRHPRPSTRAKSRAEAKIWALWYAIKPYLPPDERTAAYLMGIVARASGRSGLEPSALALLSGREAYKAIEALKQRLDQEEQKFAKHTGVPF